VTERRQTMLLIDFDPEEAQALRARMASWNCIEVTTDRLDEREVRACSPDAVAVSARKKEKQAVVRTCLEIRNRREFRNVPLLAVITRYQMHIGNEVRRIADSDFLIAPLDEATVEERLSHSGEPPTPTQN